MAVEARETGDGPPVALIHGFGIPPRHLDALARSLASRHRVIVVDLPGYGQSPPLAVASALDDAHTAVAEMLVRRGADDAFLVGFSFGGYRALVLASSPLLRPRGVVTLGGFANLTSEEREAYRQLRRLAPAVDRLLEMFLPTLFAPAFAAKRPDALAEVRRWATELDRETLLGELEAIAESPDLRPAVSALAIPIGSCAGSEDAIIPVAHCVEIAQCASHPLARCHVIPGAGHALLFEAPEAVASFVLEMTSG